LIGKYKIRKLALQTIHLPFISSNMTDTLPNMSQPQTASPNCFLQFEANTEGYTLPERFTFPFAYEPHPLSLLAAKELQTHIEYQTEWQHNFGLEDGKGIGKMFGILVVHTAKKELGYLAAFSGKLAGGNHHSRFVPPVFDVLKHDGFYRIGEEENNVLFRQLAILENDVAYINLKTQRDISIKQSIEELAHLKSEMQLAKAARDERRLLLNDRLNDGTLSATDFALLQTELAKESSHYFYQWKDLGRSWNRQHADIKAQLEGYLVAINALKEARKIKSYALQNQIFDSYTFLNHSGQPKSLRAIFPSSEDVAPPSGAGECAAPKLLQYAFLHNLTPLSMAEFWWGQSPNSEIRKHGYFYPACKSKCEPILGHMLEGIEMDENTIDINPAIGKELETVYEDAYLLVVNKPEEFFSVPGKKIDDSVLSRMRKQYPDATGPLVVHRLDSATSGLILVAKTKEVHQNLQSQFIQRTIKKRYVALLDGILEQDEGIIDLPLRVDLEDRPRQLVCYAHGKSAQTAWKVVGRENNQTKIHFFPITGRTHQLRVHASHPQGLNMSIIGDDLYGKKADRLYLHAEWLEFVHPVSNEVMTIEVASGF
jgi:tRNA pseudouridine32 synthase / 23S rRNA pseudouridine746 synthase